MKALIMMCLGGLLLLGCGKNGTQATDTQTNENGAGTTPNNTEVNNPNTTNPSSPNYVNATAPVQVADGWREVCANNTEMCDEAKIVRVRGKNGFVSIKAGESKFVELAAYTGEMHYECAGMDKTVRCGTEFSAVNIARSSGTGQLNVQFYVNR
jgi:hypothetical protein